MNLSRFDWYQATVPETASMTAVDVLAPLGDGPIRAVKGQYGYQRGWQITTGGSCLATAYEGHGKPDHIVATGQDAHAVALAIRSHLPGHTVSRADVCSDFAGGTAFYGQTRDLVRLHLGGRVILTDYVETGPDGQASTFYVGSRASETRVRMYEKGKQDQAYEPDTIRLEVQVRPAKPDRKAYAGTLEPQGFWGFSRWARWLSEEVLGEAAPAAPPRLERVSDLERSIQAMKRQYGKRLLELVEVYEGDLEAFALHLLAP